MSSINYDSLVKPVVDMVQNAYRTQDENGLDIVRPTEVARFGISWTDGQRQVRFSDGANREIKGIPFVFSEKTRMANLKTAKTALYALESLQSQIQARATALRQMRSIDPSATINMAELPHVDRLNDKIAFCKAVVDNRNLNPLVLRLIPKHYVTGAKTAATYALAAGIGAATYMLATLPAESKKGIAEAFFNSTREMI